MGVGESRGTSMLEEFRVARRLARLRVIIIVSTTKQRSRGRPASPVALEAPVTVSRGASEPPVGQDAARAGPDAAGPAGARSHERAVREFVEGEAAPLQDRVAAVGLDCGPDGVRGNSEIPTCRVAVAGRNEETEKPSFGAAAAGRNRGTEGPLCRCSRRRNGGAPLSLQPPEKRKTPRLSSLKSELRAVGTPRLDGRSSREGRHQPPEVAVWTGGLGLSALRVSVWPAPAGSEALVKAQREVMKIRITERIVAGKAIAIS
nr:hypothetical protein Iba_chr07dCG3700 [Ipomoea batatas]